MRLARAGRRAILLFGKDGAELVDAYRTIAQRIKTVRLLN